MATSTVGINHSRTQETVIEVAFADLAPEVRDALNASADLFLDYVVDCERQFRFEDGVFLEADEVWTSEQQHYERMMNR